MQVPVLTGVYADETANFREAYPVNMLPVVMESGLSAGYLRVADGAERIDSGEGIPRGGVNWNDELYRVSGTKLVKVRGNGHVILGDVGPGGRATFAYSFDRLAIASGGRLYYWNGSTLTQVTDPDLGTVLGLIWIDGYFMTTDGEFMVVTELNDPMSVSPLKYGSSEIDPDPIVTILKLRNEAVAVNRYTIEFFSNVGGSGYPFQRIEGAQIQKGALGPNCACIFADAVAFLGSGKNETPAIHLGVNAATTKISTPGIEAVLESFSDEELANAVLETHVHKSHPQLWVRLPDRTLVYDIDSSRLTGKHVWVTLTSATAGFSAYRVIDPVWCYNAWQVCDASDGSFGRMTPDSARHFGDVVRWEFTTQILYNEGRGVQFHELELFCLTGRVEAGDDPRISTQYSLDGEAWSSLRTIKAGARGDRMRRLFWLQQGSMRNWRIQRFVGDSRARIAVARLEISAEPLAL